MKKSKIIIIVFISLIICGFGLRGKISGEKFDAEKWKTVDLSLEDNWSLRWDMINSLRNNYDLIGMSKNEVVKLLGKPNEDYQKENNFSYYLGYNHTGINTGSLKIEFENGIVKISQYGKDKLLTTATTDLGNWPNGKMVLYLNDLANPKNGLNLVTNPLITIVLRES